MLTVSKHKDQEVMIGKKQHKSNWQCLRRSSEQQRRAAAREKGGDVGEEQKEMMLAGDEQKMVREIRERSRGL